MDGHLSSRLKKELVLIGLTFGSQGYVSASAVCHLELSKLMIDAGSRRVESPSSLIASVYSY
jgi:hypothetical protein